MEIKINLLPPQKKQELQNLQTVGTILKIFFMAIFSMAIFFAFLHFCTYFIVIQKRALDREVAKFEATDPSRNARSAQEYLEDQSKIANQVRKGFDDQNKFWGKIDQINQMMPDKVYLKNLEIDDESLKIQGVALNRDDVLTLKDRLEQSGLVKDLESPLSNFVSNQDVEFEFNAKML